MTASSHVFDVEIREHLQDLALERGVDFQRHDDPLRVTDGGWGISILTRMRIVANSAGVPTGGP